MKREHEFFEIEENCRRIHERDHFRCRHPNCQYNDIQIAHGIGQREKDVSATKTMWNNEFNENRDTKWIKRWVTHNPLNVWTSCQKHNSYFSISIKSKPASVREKIHEIHEQLIQSGVIK